MIILYTQINKKILLTSQCLFHLSMMIILYTLINKSFIWCYQFFNYITLQKSWHCLLVFMWFACICYSLCVLTARRCLIFTPVFVHAMYRTTACAAAFDVNPFSELVSHFFVLWNSSSSRQKRQFSGLPLPYHLATCRPFHLIFSFPLFSEHFWRNVPLHTQHFGSHIAILSEKQSHYPPKEIIHTKVIECLQPIWQYTKHLCSSRYCA